MRLPIANKGKNSVVVDKLNTINQKLQKKFENSIRNNIKTEKIKVMLGDFSVTETTTFDYEYIKNYFLDKEKELKAHKNWQVVSVQTSKSDDLCRIYFQISIEIQKFYFYIYFGVQFHSLLYYKLDKQVIDLSKRIRELEEKNNGMKSEIAIKGDQLIKQELETLGYKEVDDTKLFEELFTKQDISSKLIEKASTLETNFPEMEINQKIIGSLKKELENMIIEVYKTDLVFLDNNSVMRGEEGIIFYVDMEYIKNKKTHEKTSIINLDKVTNDIILTIEQEFNSVIDIFDKPEKNLL